MLVHPGQRAGLFARKVQTSSNLLMSHANGSVDLWMEDEPVTSIAQRFAVRGNDRHTCALMQPAVRGSHACF